MNFSTDQQTLNDLAIFGKPGAASVYQLFNNTYTRGGAGLLEQMFLYPLADAAAINERSGIFRYFSSIAGSFPFSTEHLDGAELYLGMTDERTRLSRDSDNLVHRFGQFLSADGDYQIIAGGISAILELLNTLSDFVDANSSGAAGTPYESHMKDMKLFFSDPDFAPFLSNKRGSKLSHSALVEYDQLLRFKHRLKIRNVLGWIYHIDVCLSVAEIAVKRGLVFPEALPAGQQTVKLEKFYHPLLDNAVANSIEIDPESNVIFLTGANMAGKSTLMKSLGIAIYLAHMGFPVAAVSMCFSVRDGIFTTINLPDDLSSGNSHFYAEVLRVKKVAKELAKGRNLFIIFDELFRGTNVKDAFEGTVAITEALAARANCMFLVSTHIIEAGEVLRPRCHNIRFVYLPTLMAGNRPVYTYTLKPGITADRHGMVIINNERILEIIRSRNNQQK